MKSARSIFTVAATVVLVAASAGYAAAAAPVTARVSGPSPYAACSTPPEGDSVTVGAEVEPDVAANPARPGNLIAVWQQDRWSGGGAHGLMAGYSFDGGRSWGRTTLPFSTCAPGGLDYTRASDPAVSIGPDGVAYAIGLSVDIPGTRTAVASVVSRDGGRSWTRLRVIAAEKTAVGVDKEWITADPKRPGTAYAVWDNLQISGAHYTGPTYFSATTDHGRTWTTPKAIAAIGQDRQSIGNQISVDPISGRLYDTYAYYFCTCASIGKVAYVYSDDHGRTWSRQHVVSDILTLGVVQPGTNAPVRAGGFPFAAVSPKGTLYLTWQDSRFSGGSYDEIAVSSSRDRGQHWTTPHRANKPTSRAAFTPSIAVNTSGQVAVSYYDLRRDNIHDTALSTDYWATTTRDGVHFTGDLHLAGSFDLSAAPNAGGYFLGDYEGLTAAGKGFVAVYATSNCGTNCSWNATDIYSSAFPAHLDAAVDAAQTQIAAELAQAKTKARHLVTHSTR